MGSTAVPIFVAIDEHGIVRDAKPRLDTIGTDFINNAFVAVAGGDRARRLTPALPQGQASPDFEALLKRAQTVPSCVAWRDLGDALTLWGGDQQVNAALDAYVHAANLDPKHAPVQFRLGVCYRRRYESEQRQADDFQAAINHWAEPWISTPTSTSGADAYNNTARGWTSPIPSTIG